MIEEERRRKIFEASKEVSMEATRRGLQGFQWMMNRIPVYYDKFPPYEVQRGIPFYVGISSKEISIHFTPAFWERYLERIGEDESKALEGSLMHCLYHIALRDFEELPRERFFIKDHFLELALEARINLSLAEKYDFLPEFSELMECLGLEDWTLFSPKTLAEALARSYERRREEFIECSRRSGISYLSGGILGKMFKEGKKYFFRDVYFEASPSSQVLARPIISGPLSPGEYFKIDPKKFLPIWKKNRSLDRLWEEEEWSKNLYKYLRNSLEAISERVGNYEYRSWSRPSRKAPYLRPGRISSPGTLQIFFAFDSSIPYEEIDRGISLAYSLGDFLNYCPAKYEIYFSFLHGDLFKVFNAYSGKFGELIAAMREIPRDPPSQNSIEKFLQEISSWGNAISVIFFLKECYEDLCDSLSYWRRYIYPMALVSFSRAFCESSFDFCIEAK